MTLSPRLSALCSVLALSVCFPVFAAGNDVPPEESGSWVLAASAFTLKGVPEPFSAYAELTPRLLLEELGVVQIRFVGLEESRAQELLRLAEERDRLAAVRRDLIFSRDLLFFSLDNPSARQRARKDYDGRLEETERDLALLDEQTEGVLAAGTEKAGGAADPADAGISAGDVPVTFRSAEDGLYTPREGISLARSLHQDGISGLLCGEIRDVGGYMHISVSLETGNGAPAETVSVTAPYADLEEAVYRLSLSLVPRLSGRQPVQLFFSVFPQNTSVFVDGVPVEDLQAPVTVFSGRHTIEASAPEFSASVRTEDFTESGEYSVEISLVPQETVRVVFDTGGESAALFFRTRYFGHTPAEIRMPALPRIGELVRNDVQTFFLFDPAGAGADPERVQTVSVSLDEKNAEQRIEKQRKILYWSLGALYLALPAAFLIRGEADSRLNARAGGRLPDSENVDPWVMAGNAATGVCIGLGVNLLVQIIRYAIAAEQVTPRRAEFR